MAVMTHVMQEVLLEPITELWWVVPLAELLLEIIVEHLPEKAMAICMDVMHSRLRQSFDL